MATISDTARDNIITDQGLEAVASGLSSVDLMRILLEDDTQTLVTETEATAAVHYWRYLKEVRDS